MKETRTKHIQIKVTETEHKEAKKAVKPLGFESISQMVRALIRRAYKGRDNSF